MLGLFWTPSSVIWHTYFFLSLTHLHANVSIEDENINIVSGFTSLYQQKYCMKAMTIHALSHKFPCKVEGNLTPAKFPLIQAVGWAKDSLTQRKGCLKTPQ